MRYPISFRNCFALFVLTLSSFAFSQIDESLLFPPLKWSGIGPNRGGRSIAVAGLVVEERDLVIATHWWSFWVLDDIETLRQLDSSIQDSEFYLFKPADAIRWSFPRLVSCLSINLQVRISKSLRWSIMPYTQETKHDN